MTADQLSRCRYRKQAGTANLRRGRCNNMRIVCDIEDDSVAHSRSCMPGLIPDTQLYSLKVPYSSDYLTWQTWKPVISLEVLSRCRDPNGVSLGEVSIFHGSEQNLHLPEVLCEGFEDRVVRRILRSLKRMLVSPLFVMPNLRPSSSCSLCCVQLRFRQVERPAIIS